MNANSVSANKEKLEENKITDKIYIDKLKQMVIDFLRDESKRRLHSQCYITEEEDGTHYIAVRMIKIIDLIL